MWISSIKKSYLIFIFTICGFFQADLSYSATGKAKTTLSVDTSRIEVRQPDPETKKQLLEDSDYRYDRVGPAPKSAWDRFWEWFWRKVAEIFDTEGGALGFRIFEYLLILGALALIIYLILKNDVRALFYGKSATVLIDFKEFHEDIHSIDFEALISLAISQKDYRRAVRLHFLKLLKELADRNLITWQIDKTNTDYSIELANSKYSAAFHELSMLYEYIWYGDFEPDEKNFQNTITKFNTFRI